MNQDLLARVKQEAILLRSNATQEELDNLNLDDLNGLSAEYCIYGQLTGSCYNKRATELFAQCAVPYKRGIYSDFNFGSPEPPEANMTCFDNEGNARKNGNHSAIEYYISLPENEYKLQGLVDYLQRKTDKLIL